MNGYTLIEVLISFLIFSFILIGTDVMQIQSLEAARNNYYFVVANQQVHSLIERLGVLKNGNLDEFILLWNRQNNELLPEGTGNVNGHYPSYVITIFWGKNTSKNCDKIKIASSGCLKRVVHLI